MICEAYQPLISEYTDGSLDARNRAQVQAHLAQCPACARLAADFGAMSGMLRGLPPRQTSPQFEASLAERIAQTRRPARPTLGAWLNRVADALHPQPSLLRPALAFGAACALVAGAVFFTHPAEVALPTPSNEPALVSQCVQQHRSYVETQPLSDLAAQSLANQLDESATAPPATTVPREDSL